MRRLVMVDTETGGLDPAVHSILTLAAVVWEDGKLGDSFHVMVHEENLSVTPEALKVNGLSEDTIHALGVHPSMAVTLFHEWLHKNNFPLTRRAVIMGGHNVHFDAGFVNRLYRLANRTSPFSHRLICTQSAAQFLMLGGHIADGPTSLNALTKHYGIEIREAGAKHDALEDAVAAGKLLNNLLEELI